MIDTDEYKSKLTSSFSTIILRKSGLELLAEVERLQSEPTVTVDDYHKKGHLYITVNFPNGEQYVGLVEKWEGDEE